MSDDDDDKLLPRSNPIIKTWRATGYKPTEEERADYWRAYSKDVLDTIKSDYGRHVHGIMQASWAKFMAYKAAKSADELERRVQRLEHRKSFAYRGIFAAGDEYDQGDYVTHAGSLWYCHVSGTRDRPGTSDDWQLAVKRKK